MKQANLNVGKRIVLGFAVPILLFSAFGLWLQFAMVAVSERLQHIEGESATFALLAKDMEKDIVQVQQYLSDISATRGQDGLDDGFKLAEANYVDFNMDIERFNQLFAARGDQRGAEKMRDIKASFEAYYRAGIKMAQAYVEGGHRRVINSWGTSTNPARNYRMRCNHSSRPNWKK
ncbi:MAG: hypothetical protein HY306_02955 [Nitrosomonadales bacterium]|nr:hypothetical protein [Nitrosomonadales bacterium]